MQEEMTFQSKFKFDLSVLNFYIQLFELKPKEKEAYKLIEEDYDTTIPENFNDDLGVYVKSY
jgi:hypothetical protein